MTQIEHEPNGLTRRSEVAARLATSYPELKGLDFTTFLEQLPGDLDFIDDLTARLMFRAINEQ